MTNTYTLAVDFITDYIKATENVFEDGTLPSIETGLEYALKVLREQPEYDERTTAQ